MPLPQQEWVQNDKGWLRGEDALSHTHTPTSQHTAQQHTAQQHTAHSTQHTAHSTTAQQHNSTTAHSTQHAAHTTQRAARSTQHTAHTHTHTHARARTSSTLHINTSPLRNPTLCGTSRFRQITSVGDSNQYGKKNVYRLPVGANNFNWGEPIDSAEEGIIYKSGGTQIPFPEGNGVVRDGQVNDSGQVRLALSLSLCCCPVNCCCPVPDVLMQKSLCRVRRRQCRSSRRRRSRRRRSRRRRSHRRRQQSKRIRSRRCEISLPVLFTRRSR